MKIKYLLIVVLFIMSSNGYSQDTLHGAISLRHVIETTLSQNPTIKIKELDVVTARGNYLTTYGSFDPVLGINLGYSSFYSPTYSDYELENPIQGTSTYSVGLTKPFSWGGNLSLLLEMTKSIDTLDYSIPQNVASVSLQFELPLLKGLGNGTSGEELSAKLNLEAERKNFLFIISQQVLNSIQSYWNYLGAIKSRDIIQKSVDEAEGFYENSRLLNAEDSTKYTDLTTLQATISQKKIDLTNADHDIYTTRQTLGIAMGIDFEKIEEIPVPETQFLFEELLVPDSAFIMSLPVNKIIDIALEHRQDYLASLDMITASDYLVKQAENGTLSELDLTLNAGYSGATEGEKFGDFFRPFYKNVAGLNLGATLSYKLPFGNNTAKGNLMSASAQYIQNKIASVELRRQIRTSVSTQIKQFQTNYLNFLETERIVLYNAKSLEEEKEKMAKGLSNSINVDYVERNMLASRLSNVKAMQNLSLSIVKLRHELGILINSKGEANFIDLNTLNNFK